MNSRFILFLVFIIVFPLFNIDQVEAQDPYYTLDLECDKPFYWKGETIQVNVTSNSSVPVTLSLYWNWKTYTENQLIYRDTRVANATWNLPTGNQKAGFYRIVANTSDRTITTWRTLIHRKGYVPASLPFSYVWDGINYTFQGRTLRAETTRDYLEIKYPKIPFYHSTNFYRNNMSFVIRLKNETQGWKVDVAYYIMYGCLKWFINGTLNSPKTFDFKLAHNPLTQWKKQLDSMRGEGNLVFDWGDIRKMKQAFTWNQTSKTLHVTIPETFTIDPTIFQDGFESGNFSAWTGTTTSGTGTLSVQSVEAREGTYASNSTVTSSGAWSSANCYKTFTGESTVYARCYVYLDSWSGGYTRGILALISNVFGILSVRLESTRNVTARYRDGASIIENTSNTVLPTGEWICLEAAVYVHATSGWVRIYVNDVELSDVTQTGIDTADYGDITQCRVGLNNAQNLAATLFFDSVIVDTTYIGLISEGEEVTHELTETFNITDNTITRRSRTITEAETITVTSVTSYGTERLFTYTETLTLSALNIFRTERLLTFLETLSMVDGQTVRYGLFYALSETISILDDSDMSLTRFVQASEFIILNSTTSTAVATAVTIIEALGTINILDNFNLQIARLVVASETIIINSVHSIALQVRISLVEAFESINILTGLTTTRVTIPTATTIDDAVALAAIALIIALCAFVGVGVKSKRE